jgi:hypothetical protein
MTRRAYHDKEQRTDAVVRFTGTGEPLDVVEDDSGVIWVHGEGVLGTCLERSTIPSCGDATVIQESYVSALPSLSSTMRTALRMVVVRFASYQL